MIRLYFRLVGATVRSQMQYKASFIIEVLGFALTTGLEWVTLAILFGRFPSLAGWSIAEVALLYGLTSLAFSLAEMIARGFDAPFELMMERGTFDGVLIRPLGAFFQVLASEFQLRRLGRSLQALGVLGYAFARLPIRWSPDKLLVVPLTLASGTLIFIALIVGSGTICFWTIRTPQIVHVFLSGGDFLMSHPFSIYNRWLRGIFTAIIPLAFVNYPAALWLLERSDPHGFPAWLAWYAPLVAAAFFGVALLFWRFGVSKYTSSGS